MGQRFRTIVADPPWQHASGGPRTAGAGQKAWRANGGQAAPYSLLSVDQIAALPVANLAEDDAHLYLWTTNRFLRDAFEVAEAWGFRFSTVLTWCKTPMGLGPGGAYAITTEYLLFARRGKLAPLRRYDTSWFHFKRPHRGGSKRTGRGGPIHSAKPDGFFEVIEQVSPGPYVELFARRSRLGWERWGDEADSTIELPVAALSSIPIEGEERS